MHKKAHHFMDTPAWTQAYIPIGMDSGFRRHDDEADMGISASNSAR